MDLIMGLPTSQGFDTILTNAQERATVEAFYSGRDYAPLWLTEGHANARAQSAIGYLSHVDADGLNPADYPVPDFAAASDPAANDPAALAQAEIRLTESALDYARHAQIGRVHYSRVTGDIFYELNPPQPLDVLSKLASAKNTEEVLDSYQPPHAAYKALRKKLAEARGKSTTSGSAQIARGPVLELATDKKTRQTVLMTDERVPQFTEDGVQLYQRGDYPHARECFEMALQLHPGDANLMYNVAECHDREGNTGKAEEMYRLCLDRSANHARCRHSLALLLYRTGEARKARQMIEDWVAAEPQSPDALVEDGWRLRQGGELHQALARYQQARHHDPNHVRALTELGLLYEQQQQPDDALRHQAAPSAAEPGRRDADERQWCQKEQCHGKRQRDHQGDGHGRATECLAGATLQGGGGGRDTS